MRRIFIFFLFLFISIGLFAQNTAVDHIRDLYKKTLDNIAASASGQSQGERLYCTEININKYGADWRAVGSFSKVIRFWYNDQPAFAELEKGNKAAALVMAEIVSKWSEGKSENWNLLFEDGSIILCFMTMNNGMTMNPVEEKHWFFKDGKLIRYMEGQEVANTLPDAASVTSLCNKITELFYQTFN